MTQRDSTLTRATGLNVLVVDDERYTREIMTVLIAALGHRVHAVDSGRAALDWLLVERRPVDVILMDVLMPGLDGLETVRRLRADPASKPVAIVGLSAKASGTVRAEGLQAGCDVYLTKPVREDRIFAAITEALMLKGRLSPGETFA
ncbi:Gliding motility regulatory protein [compost metagenome]